MITPYDEKTESYMVNYFESLLERDKRRYVAIEVSKLGWGGQSYLSRLLGISRPVINKAKRELENPALQGDMPPGRQRRRGGGRKKKKPS